MKLVLFIILIGMVAACGPPDPSENNLVVATTGMVGDAARAIGGDVVDVEVLMGPGVDPHYYRATASDLTLLGEARLILYNGLNLEGRLAEVLESLGNRAIAVAEVVQEELILTDEESGYPDPHVWFDASLWALVSDRVLESLAEAFPELRSGFEERHSAYRQGALELHSELQSAVAAIPPQRRVLVTAHDAFRYFGRAYGIEVMGLQGISTVDEASTRDVQELADLLVTRRIPALFVESSVAPRSMEAVREAARARGFEVRVGGELFSDALGTKGTPEGTWKGMLRHNMKALKAGLGEQP